MTCKSTEKTTGGDSNLSSISNILKMITSVFRSGDVATPPLPPPLILAGANCGISASDMASKVISRLPEAGIPLGDVYQDGPNAAELLVKIMMEEVTNALQTQASVQVAINPGVQVQGVGVGNLGAPIAVQGATTGIATGRGVIC
jgi:hypothetical protein